MVAQRFLLIGWSMQLFVGCILFIISLFFEARVLTAFFQNAWVAWGLATALELGKALAIVWYRLNASLYGTALLLKIVSAFFRIGLIILSVVCTLLFLANYLDKPTLEQTAAADRQELAERHHRETKVQQNEIRLTQQRLVDIHGNSLRDIDKLYKPAIGSLREKLNQEMNNVVRGIFKGPRYREFERLLALELERYKQAVRLKTDEFNLQLAQANAKASDNQKTLIVKQKKELQDLQRRNYSLDERANDPHVIAFINLLSEVFSTTLKPLQFVFYFSVLLSLLVELGIWLAFDTITSSAMPELVMQRKHDFEMGQRHADVSNVSAAHAGYEKQTMNTVVRKARETIEGARRAKVRFDTAA